MNSKVKIYQGYNLWFNIEILSFYGYLISAILFIFIHSLESSLGMLDKRALERGPHKNAYQYDFIEYHRVEFDWFALVFILLFVNTWLIFFDTTRPSGHEGDHY